MNTENAYAKINISLDVTGARPDGYHDMLMVMQTISLCDTVTVTPGGSGIRARCSYGFIPSDARNLAVRAALTFFESAGREPEAMTIDIKKRIPVGAGLAGGSADAAAVLRCLYRLYPDALSPEQLFAAAEQTGSDVPFCLVGGTKLAAGRGEQLSQLPPMPDCRYALVKPSFSISTPELFKKLDRVRLRRHPDTAGIGAALESGDLAGVSRRMYNVFEDVDDRRMRTVSQIKSAMLGFGALGTVMTGTGSAVFGVFSNEEAARAAVAELGSEFGFSCVAENIGELFPLCGE